MICGATPMQRCILTDAIIIRRGRFGEFHKSLTLLTPGMGLVAATAYGAYKTQSRLRMASEPFTHCAAQLYLNPVSHSCKVTELEVRESFPRLQADLARIGAASLWVEVVQKSYAAGDLSGALYALFLECLRLVERADPRDAQYITIQFLWRFLALSGSQPDVEACDSCGLALGVAAEGFYDTRSGSLLCEGCSAPEQLRIPAGARRYLAAGSILPLPEACALRLDTRSFHSLREALYGITRAVLEGDLATVRCLGAVP